MATHLVTTVHINKKSLQNKIDMLAQDEGTMLALHVQLAKTIDPWVPYLTGMLAHRTIQITPQCIRYTQPYARYQYYGVGFNHTTDVHPLASAMWDKVALQSKGDSFLKSVEKILKRRARVLRWSRFKWW